MISNIALYYSPGSCARVSMMALEEIGIPYELRLLRFAKGEHQQPEYLQQNPKARVPLLVVDGWPLSENVAILSFLARKFPEARLLPNDTHKAEFEAMSWLAFCASGLHPIVTRLRIPTRFCDVPGGAKRVWEMASADLDKNFAVIEERLVAQEWIMGDWSVIDPYLFWVWYRVTGAGYDVSKFPRIADHAERIAGRPSVARGLEREREANATLKREGLARDFPVVVSGAVPHN